jgi:hypothetical protein
LSRHPRIQESRPGLQAAESHRRIDRMEHDDNGMVDEATAVGG